MNATKVSQYEYAVHPLANLFPEITGDEYDQLKEDIKAHGQREPIMLDEADEVLLDGRARLRICKELGITPRIDRFHATPADTEADFIYSRNILRRHLTDGQRAAIAVQFADAIREAAKEKQKRKPESVLMDSSKQNPIHTRQLTAKQAGVSEYQIQQAETVAKHAPELLPAVERGEVTLISAATAAKKKATPRLPSFRSAPLRLEKSAARWIGKISAQFMEHGYANADADEVAAKLTEDEMDTFLALAGWMNARLRNAVTDLQRAAILEADALENTGSDSENNGLASL